MLDIKKLQRTAIKITVRCYYIPVKTAKIKQTDNTEDWQDVEEQELSYTVGGNTEGSNQFRSQFGRLLNIETFTYSEVVAQEN